MHRIVWPTFYKQTLQDIFVLAIIVFQCKLMPIARHHKDIADFHICDLYMTKKKSFKVKG